MSRTFKLKDMVEIAHTSGIGFQVASQDCDDFAMLDEKMRVKIRNDIYINFGSCSYLGLHRHPALIEGAVEAVRKYGTQFASSRAYLSAPLYNILDDLLNDVFGNRTVPLCSTLSLVHQAVFQAIIGDEDAVLIAKQAHNSIHQALALVRYQHNIPVLVVNHTDCDEVLEEAKRLSGSHRYVWFLTDGIYSMFGDKLDIGLARDFLSLSDNTRLYVDDAHGTGVAGLHGRGDFVERFGGYHDRLVLTATMSKAFCGGGGLVIVPMEDEYNEVRYGSGPQMFSGPLQPPLLGASIGALRVALSDDFTNIQTCLNDRIAYADERLSNAGLARLFPEYTSQVFYYRIGEEFAAFDVANRMINDKKIWLNLAVFPAVPRGMAGLRFCITAAHSEEDIDYLVDSLSEAVKSSGVLSGK